MAKTDILAMKAGPELDGMIAHKLFGWELCSKVGSTYYGRPPTLSAHQLWVEQQTGRQENWPVPAYSSIIADAWLVVDRMRQWIIDNTEKLSESCTIDDGPWFELQLPSPTAEPHMAGMWFAGVGRGIDYEGEGMTAQVAFGETAPLAICRFALIALEDSQ